MIHDVLERLGIGETNSGVRSAECGVEKIGVFRAPRSGDAVSGE